MQKPVHQKFSMGKGNIQLRLGLSYGFLLVMVVALSLCGLVGLNNNAESLRFLSKASSLFDELVYAREQNFNSAINEEVVKLGRFQESQGALVEFIEELHEVAQDGRLKGQYLEKIKGIEEGLEQYRQAREASRTNGELLSVNSQLGEILRDVNDIYYAEEIRSTEFSRKLRYIFVFLPPVALLIGLLIAIYTTRRVGASYRRLDESESRLSAILDTAVDGIVTINSRGVVQDVNGSVERLFGWKRAELIGKNVSMLMPDSDRSQHDGYLERYLASEEPKIMGSARDVMARHKDGSEIPMRLAVGRVELPGELLFVGFLSDITARHALEASLRDEAERASQAVAAKSIFLANMSHEVRTPMNSIIGFTELLLKREMCGNEREYLEIIRSSSLVLLKLVNDILDITKMEKGSVALELVDFSLKDLALQIESSLRLGAEAKKVEFVVFYPEDMSPHFVGDPLRIQQILSNLLSNGIKFTSEGHVSMSFAYEDGIVIVKISDTGIGMSPDQISSIFEPFTQADVSISRRFGGTGLGTTIALQLAQLMGGKINVESVLGQGSTFEVCLPLKVGKAKIHYDAPTSARALPPLNVLIADDVPQNLSLLTLTLQDNGHSVTASQNGEEAFERFVDGEFDVVLMDVHMPEVDGLQATQMIRHYEETNNLARTPIIALTASVMDADRRSARQAGMDGFATKPLDLPRLFDEMERVLKLHSKVSLSIESELADLQSSGLSNADDVFVPLIDWSKGVSIWGGRARYVEALEQFLSSAIADKAFPEGDVELIDWEPVKFALHRLRGAASNLALPALSDLSGTLEEMIVTGWYEEAILNFPRIYRLLDSVSQELKAHITGDSQGCSPGSNEPSRILLLALMRSLIDYLSDAEMHEETIEDVCSGLMALGELDAVKRLRAELAVFEFESAISLLESFILLHTELGGIHEGGA